MYNHMHTYINNLILMGGWVPALFLYWPPNHSKYPVNSSRYCPVSSHTPAKHAQQVRDIWHSRTLSSHSGTSMGWCSADLHGSLLWRHILICLHPVLETCIFSLVPPSFFPWMQQFTAVPWMDLKELPKCLSALENVLFMLSVQDKCQSSH